MKQNPIYIIRPPESRREWEVVRGLLQDYRNEFDDETCFTSFDQEMENLEGYYADPRKYKLIAVERPGNQIVGCVGLRALSPDVAEMKRLYVRPSHRGKLLGKKLAEEIMDIAIKMKFKKMVLDTMHEMKDAQKLYRDLGFVACEPYEDQDPEKMVCYEKNLKE